MARHVVHVRTSMPNTEAFAYMADLTDFAEWDPGVEQVGQVEGDGDGAIVTYDAVLRLKGLPGLSDRLLALTFNQIGDRAAAGLVDALSGERVAASAA